MSDRPPIAEWAAINVRLASVSGQGSVARYIREHPALSLLQLAAELRGRANQLSPPDPLAKLASAAMLASALLAEAERAGKVRDAAAELLVRSTMDGLPGGWSVPRGGFEPRFVNAAAGAMWCDLMRHAPDLRWADAASSTWKALRALEPPVGWRPQVGDDLLERAFAEGWTLE